LYLRLSQEYELARIEEKKDIADFRVLDTASVPTKPSGPARTRLTLIAGVTSAPVAAAGMLLWQFCVHWFASVRGLIDSSGQRLCGGPRQAHGLETGDGSA
jgi:uncharacterized protein involved in exopolysaccharide biosynthesis